MKKYFPLVCLLATLLLCSCKAKTQTAEVATDSVPQAVKIADYLFEITVDDYCDTVPNYLIAEAGKEFGCSAVRNGNFYGRNLDFFISEISEIVVRTTAKEGRHASVGVGRLKQMTDAEIEAGLTKELIYILPWGMFDGINDAGFFCNMNVTPMQDAGLVHTNSNPGKPDVQSTFLVRALLDNCATVDEAIEYINNHNIIGMNKGGWDLHFMIGDPEKTVVLEFIDNEAVIKEQTIMTNFFVNKLPEITPHADGLERYDILKENYAEGGESMQGMYNLLKRVRFSQAYDPETKPFWKSEYYEGMPYTIDTPLETILADSKVQEGFNNFKNYKETGKYTPEMGLWYTEHNSTYDIANRKLWVTVHEDYDHHYEFALTK
ncbi:MAG: linear amide C-N hydrolase [Bacteroidaceae bacterium]|nr:linear amide C-N hydrolase [Bacteroidaceae bacterium]